jgi:hypothetical protein
MRHVPWTAIDDLRGDPELINKLDEARDLVEGLRKALTKRG